MNVQPLIFFSKGTKGTIYDFNGGKMLSKRIYEMGLNKGQEIEIIKNDVGPLVIGLQSSRIAIGRGMAYKIMFNPN